MKRKGDNEVENSERPLKQHQKELSTVEYRAGLLVKINNAVMWYQQLCKSYRDNLYQILLPTDPVIGPSLKVSHPAYSELRRFVWTIKPDHKVANDPSNFSQSFNWAWDSVADQRVINGSRPCGGHMSAAFVHITLPLYVLEEIYGWSRMMIRDVLAYHSLNPASIRLVQEYATMQNGPTLAVALFFRPANTQEKRPRQFSLLQACVCDHTLTAQKFIDDQLRFLKPTWATTVYIAVPYAQRAERMWAENHF